MIVRKYAGKIDNLDPQLRRASGFAFYNRSRYDFEKMTRRRSAGIERVAPSRIRSGATRRKCLYESP
ncbi:MAG: hypothetical protein F4X11_26700 [Acidobacteria bacterium]|nr:hypothetical protein [Acidobacteriota bacterium]